LCPISKHEKIPAQKLRLHIDAGCCSDPELSGTWSLNAVSCGSAWQSAGWLIFARRLGQNTPEFSVFIAIRRLSTKAVDNFVEEKGKNNFYAVILAPNIKWLKFNHIDLSHMKQ